MVYGILSYLFVFTIRSWQNFKLANLRQLVKIISIVYLLCSTPETDTK